MPHKKRRSVQRRKYGLKIQQRSHGYFKKGGSGVFRSRNRYNVLYFLRGRVCVSGRYGRQPADGGGGQTGIFPPVRAGKKVQRHFYRAARAPAGKNQPRPRHNGDHHVQEVPHQVWDQAYVGRRRAARGRSVCRSDVGVSSARGVDGGTAPEKRAAILPRRWGKAALFLCVREKWAGGRRGRRGRRFDR